MYGSLQNNCIQNVRANITPTKKKNETNYFEKYNK